MNRLQKKCLAASGSVHFLLLVVVLFGTAFIAPKKKSVTMERLNVVPTKLIDAAFSGGGGNPQAPRTDEQVRGQLNPPPEPPPKAEPPPKKDPPKKADPPPAAPAAKKPVKLPADTASAKPQDTVPPKIELKRIKRSQSEGVANQIKAERAAAETAARARAAQQSAGRISQAMSTLRSGFSQGTAVDTYGPGGEAYANYEQFVKAVYDDAWVVTGTFDDENASAYVTVRIAAEGFVISSQITKTSGNALLDGSVRAALNKVKFVAPFPEGAKEKSRTFTIRFDLNAKLRG